MLEDLSNNATITSVKKDNGSCVNKEVGNEGPQAGRCNDFHRDACGILELFEMLITIIHVGVSGHHDSQHMITHVIIHVLYLCSIRITSPQLSTIFIDTEV